MVPIAAGRAECLEAFDRMPALLYRYRGENGIGGRSCFDKVVASRTILSEPPILIRYEAKSLVNAESEPLVQEMFARASRGRTTRHSDGSWSASFDVLAEQ